jgi:hypothetical protein
MEHIPKNELTEGWKCYFIEHKETREWWAGEDVHNENVWTKDPMKAYPFDYQFEAEIRAMHHKIDDVTEVTEHLFLTERGS